MIVSKGSSGCGPLRAGDLLRPADAGAADRDPQPAVGCLGGAGDRGLRPAPRRARRRRRSARRRARRRAPAPFSALTSAIVTGAPRSCSARTVASPRPEAPPTTIAPAALDLAWRGSLHGAHARERSARTARRGRCSQRVSSRPAAARSPSRRSGVNLALISVRSSSPSAKWTSSSSALDRARARARRAQAHLDPLVLGGRRTRRARSVEVEVGVQLAVEHARARCG